MAWVGLAVALLAQAAVSWTAVARGSSSGIMDRREVVIRSTDEWRALWNEHSSEPVPAIDFSLRTVVGVFLGTRPTAGHEVTIVAVRAERGTAVVEYRERQPGRGAVVAQVLTSPFHLVSLPRQTGRIEFRRVEGP